MLICSGTINGQFYDEANVNVNLLIDKFRIPPMNGTPKTFRLIPGGGLIKKDRSNPGQKLVTPGVQMSPMFTVSTNEGSLTIRYATNKTPIPGGGGTYRYAPKKMSFIRNSEYFYFGQEAIEQYVWAYLHPKNRKSPFAKQAQYEYYDAAAEATSKMDLLKTKMELMQVIALMGENEMRMRAAGVTYTVDNRRVSFPGAMSKDQAIVRNDLVNALNNHGKAFIDAWNSAESNVLGVAMMAQNLGIIETNPITGGVEWRFTAKHGGARICVATNQQQPIQVLVGEITSQYNLYFPRLKGLIDQVNSGRSVDPAPATQEQKTPVELTKDYLDGISSESLVALLDQHEIIGFERANSTVYTLRKNGTLLKPVKQVNDAKKWREEIAEYFNTEEGSIVRQDLSMALIKKQ